MRFSVTTTVLCAASLQVAHFATAAPALFPGKPHRGEGKIAPTAAEIAAAAPAPAPAPPAAPMAAAPMPMPGAPMAAAGAAAPKQRPMVLSKETMDLAGGSVPQGDPIKFSDNATVNFKVGNFVEDIEGAFFAQSILLLKKDAQFNAPSGVQGDNRTLNEAVQQIAA